MGIADVFKSKQFKTDIERLTAENAYLSSLLTPEMKEATKLNNLIMDLKFRQQQLNNDLTAKQAELKHLTNQIEEKKKNLIFLDDETLYQNFAIYTPVYDLMNSEEYKKKLTLVRDQQKAMVKHNTAVFFPTTFTYNNSLEQGKKFVADNVKQILRAFNNECEAIIEKTKFNNIEAIRKRIRKSYDDLNKLNSKIQITINPVYLELKFQEMNLCYEYSIKKQEEKEEAKRIRDEQREAQRLQKEIEEARKTSEKERNHYINALNKILSQLQTADEITKQLLLSKQSEIEAQLQAIEEELRKIDYREANQKAGYVYIISNIGSFGENIYKIGMTRRLEPMDRVDELGDASVPFRFDVHALIFSDDAPALEASLHRAFENKKVNMVNSRREFFNVTLEEIEQVVKENYDKTVEFTKTPAAEQYRESQMIRRHSSLPELTHSTPPVIHEQPSTLRDADYIYTKWGKYERPNPYRVDLTRGPRNK